MTEPTDGQLLAHAPHDPQAFATLVERHLTPIYRYVARRLGPTHAEDIMSEVFATAYERRDRFDQAVGDARPWLLGIATNLIRRQRRQEARQLRAYARTGVDPFAPGADQEATLGQDGPALAAALAAMRPDHRDALLLLAVAELSLDEISVALGVPVGTVKSWLHRGRATAAAVLADHGVLPLATLELNGEAR